jgi:hypothetical protein
VQQSFILPRSCLFIPEMSSDKAEFANFFDLLVRLASKENRKDFWVPRDLTPLLQKLETALSDQEFTAIPSTTNSRHYRRKSLADGDVAKFPLAEEYPFTFKLMIHKLYDMDEWAKKVREAVEESQSHYKPLPEDFKSPRQENADHDEVTTSRAVKKRCTGRNRAVSGPSFVPELGRISNAARAVNETSNENSNRQITTAAPTPRLRIQSLSPIDTNIRPLKRSAPIEEESLLFKAVKPSKAAQYAALSHVGAQNFQVKKRVRSSTFSTAPSGAIVNKRACIP